MRANQQGGKREELRRCQRHSPELTALRSLQDSAKKRKKNQVAIGTPFSQEEQRNTVSIPQESSVRAAAEHSGLERMKHRGAVVVVWQSAIKTKGCIPLPSQSWQKAPEEAVEVSVWLQSTLSANQRTRTTETCFPLVTGARCNSPQCQVQIYREAVEVCQSPLQDSKATKAAASFPSSRYPTHCSCTTGSIWDRGQHWDFTDLETHHLPHSFIGLVP